MDVSRAAHKADAGSNAGENFAEKQLPIRAGEGHAEVAQRHPYKREQEHAPGAEPVDNISARNLHSSVREENAGRQ